MMQALPVIQEFFGATTEMDKHCDTALDAHSEIEGKLVCTGPTRISGKVTGIIVARDVLIIDHGATVTADVTAEKVIVHGRMTGRLTASISVSLSESAIFEGELDAPTVQMEEGARFEGASNISGALREADPDADENVPSPVHQLQSELAEFVA